MLFLSVHRGASSGFRSITSYGSARNRGSWWASGSRAESPLLSNTS